MAVPQEWALPPALRSRLGHKVGRQRAMAADGHLLLLLHRPPRHGRAPREGVAFWRDPQGQWRTSAATEGLVALRKVVEDYEKMVGEVESEFQAARDSEGYFTTLQAIAPLHRAARNMHAALQTARESLHGDRDLITLRDQSGDVERAAELLHTDAKNALDYAVARHVEEQARLAHHLHAASHRLNLMAAFFMPIMAVGTLFGMNLTSGMEETSPVLFWGILLVGLMMGAALYACFALLGTIHRTRKHLAGPGHGRPEKSEMTHARKGHERSGQAVKADK